MSIALHPNEPRFLSRPFPVEWAGWRTTTVRLSQCGWQFATQIDFGELLYRFVLRHEQLELVGMVDWTHIEHAVVNPCYDDNRLPILHVSHLVKSLYGYREPPRYGLTDWHLVDGRPQISCEPVLTLEDMSVFAKLQPKEILIPQANLSVVEQLEAIIKAQEPKQHELRQLVLAKPQTLRPIASIAEVA